MRSTKKGSVLAISLIILSSMLVMALSMALVTVRDRKATLESTKSNQAFQTADNGIEAVLNAIIKGDIETIGEIDGSIADATCGGGTINSPEYKIELFDAEGEPLSCSDNAEDEIHTVAKIKSTGMGISETRAIEAAVAAGKCYTICDHDSEVTACREAQDNNGEGTVFFRAINCISTDNHIIGTELYYSRDEWQYRDASNMERTCKDDSILVARLDC